MRLTSRTFSRPLFIATLAVAMPLSALAGVSSAPAPQSAAPARPVMLLDKGDKSDQEKEKQDRQDRKDRKEQRSERDKEVPQTEAQQRESALRAIAEAADRLVSSDGLPSVLDLIAIRDRERLEGDLKKADLDPLNRSAREFGQVWREKYRSGFDATKNFDKLKGERVELRDGEGDKQYAFVYFSAFGGWKPFEMHLSRQKDGAWRIQLPNDLRTEQFVKDLSYDVQKLVNDKNRWPEGELLGYNNAVTQLVHAMAFPSEAEQDRQSKRR